MEKNEKKLSVKRITKIALCTAILCILGPLSLPIPISDVPVALSILGIYLTIIIIGMGDGTISIMIYLLIGLVGVPVFAGFTGGVAKLAGPTGGYLVAYIPMALVAGFFVSKFKRKIPYVVLGLVLGTIVCYIFGTVWLMLSLKLTFKAALMAGVIPFIPFDAAKMVVAILVGIPVYKAVAKIGA